MRLALRALPLALVLPASAQTALLREGDAAPGGAPGQTIRFINNTAVNQSGGFAATMTVDDAGVDVSQVWGSFNGTAPTVLRSEATFGTLVQNSFESFFGISATGISYSPSVDDTAGSTGLDGVWLDDSIVGIEEMMIPGTTDFISFGSRPGVTEDGTPYFVGGRTDTQGGGTQGRVLFFGAGPGVLLQSGDVLPNLPAALSNSGISFDFRFSALGTHYMTEVDLEGGSTEDAAITIDGAGLILDGTLVQESLLIPLSVGGDGVENWDNFDYEGITETGEYMFTGDTDGSTTTDEFIVRNGVIWAREGDVLGGETLTGSIEAAFLNEAGELAFIWDVVDGTSDLEALYFEDTLLLKEGDEVDWDGDGMLDPGVVVTNFTGISALTLALDGTVYFTADVDVNGTVLEGFFKIDGGDVGTNYCMANANSTGVPAAMTSTGSALIASNDLVLTCLDMPNNAFAFFIVSQTQGFVMNPGGSSGNICIAGDVGRNVGGSILNTGSAGMVSASVDWTAIPQPLGPVMAMPGETWNFQCWMRDSDPMGMATSNLSDGYAVTVQ